MQDSLSSQDREAIEASFVADPTGGPRWPITVSPSFLEGLKSIDQKLELRWMPVHGCFGVFMRMSRERYWRTPVHSIHNGRDLKTNEIRFRPPSETDLSAIRKARYMLMNFGHMHKIEEMDKMLLRQDREREEWKDRELNEWADKACQKHNITYKDFDIERGGSMKPRKIGPKTADFARA